MENKVTQEDIENAIYLSSKQYRKYVPPTKYIDTKQPLFTLTEEEVEIARKLINKGMDKLGHEIKFNRINPHFFKNACENNLFRKEPLFRKGNNLLNRIKQFKDESNTITK